LTGLKGKLALVAGGTGALGREVCKELLARDARVITSYRDAKEFEELVAETASAGAEALTGTMADITDPVQVAALIENISHPQESGSPSSVIDILVNAVGAYAGGKNVWEDELTTYERMMALNLKSGFVLARAVLPGMIRQNRGWIVNVASRAAYGHAGAAALYAASKAGALALFDSLAEEVKPYKINVNSVVPSIFDTPANRRAMPGADYDLWPKPADIARVIVFLCSEQASVIHGAALPVYGRT